MRVQLLLHGVLIRLAGAESITLECAASSTVQDALDVLARQSPALANELMRCACAIGDALVSRDMPLQADCELALIPPVSGG